MRKKATYKSSGVDINKANSFVKAIRRDVAATLTSSVLKRKGSFASLYELKNQKIKEPVLVSSTDGVGTKLLLARDLKKHDTIGIDLVAMNVNDILCCGAKPLFFLDYIACGQLKASVLKNVVKGIARGCKESGCALIGGETAEMPGLYKKDDYDLAGFAVGVVDRKKIIDGSAVKEGDQLIGLPSSGLHSNGYSLARKVLSSRQKIKYAKELLQPTKIYVKDVLDITERFKLKGLAHITGGAYYDKLTKILPKGKCFVMNRACWPVPEIFKVIQKQGHISDREMYRTFNMGIGLVMVIAKGDLDKISSYLKRKKIRHYFIGKVVKDLKRKIVL